MKLYDFILTTQSPKKYYRHIVFWLSWLIYLVSVQVFFSYSNPNGTNEYSILHIILREIIEVISEMAYLYFILYFLMPRYFVRNKKILFAMGLFLSSSLIFFIYYQIQQKPSENLLYNLWFHLGNFIGIGPVCICVLFITIKVMKNYYLEMEEKHEVEREKTNVEIQFLKAQVHPHFLFNTLNNIYSFTLLKSPQAAILVTKLSATLSYMINDCKESLITVEKELKMLSDYIALEKVRYGTRLNLEVEIKGNPQNKLIVPLLLIPFVENSFKHGASKMLNYPWIKLYIENKENLLLFELSNNKPLTN